jgi:hypothetical protein
MKLAPVRNNVVDRIMRAASPVVQSTEGQPIAKIMYKWIPQRASVDSHTHNLRHGEANQNALETAAVSEPASLLLLGTGIAGRRPPKAR